MSNLKTISGESVQKRLTFWILIGGLLLGAALLGGAGFFVFRYLPMGQAISTGLAWLFATNSTHTTWYITRAAGWVAYFLLWFSTVWGLAIPTKFFERFLSPTFAVDFHEYISLLSIGFVILHVSVLLIDQYLPFSLAQILIPFIAPYRPLWVGLGVIGLYLTLLVTITFYLRKKIGQKKFKAIHTLSLVGYLGVVLHAFFAGSDSSLRAVQFIYISTFMVIVFLTSYWLINAKQMKKDKEMPALPSKQTQPVRQQNRKVV
jgi:sulfoxide reductase heme-binding subunit YedZ